MSLLEQLKNIPQFNSLEKAVKEKLTINNTYVEHFAPEQCGYRDEKDDDGCQVVYPFYISDSDAEQQAIENLLDDNTDWFDEFVHEALRSEVTELVRVLIKEMRK